MCTAAAKAAAEKAKAAAAAAAEVAVATAEETSRSRRLSPRCRRGDRTNGLLGEIHRDTETGGQVHPAPQGERARTKTDELGSGKNSLPSPRYLSSNRDVESAADRRLPTHEKYRSAEEESFSLQDNAVASEGSSEGKIPCHAAEGVKKKCNTTSEEKFTTGGGEAGLLRSAALSASSSTAQRPGVSRRGSLESKKRRQSDTSQVLLPCGSSRGLMEKGSIGGDEKRPGNDVHNTDERHNYRLSWRSCTDVDPCEISPNRLDGKSDAERRSRFGGATLSPSDCRVPFSQSKRAERRKKFSEARIRMVNRSYDMSRACSQEEFGDHSSSDETERRRRKVKLLGGQGVLRNFEASVESPLCQARSCEGDESESGRSERCRLLRAREERRRKQVTRESRDRIGSRRGRRGQLLKTSEETNRGESRESPPSSSFHSNATKEKEETEERLQHTQRSRITSEPCKDRQADEKHQRCLSFCPPLRQSRSRGVDRSCESERSKDTRKMETHMFSYTSSERHEGSVSRRSQTPATASGEGETAAEERPILPEQRRRLSASPRASQAEASSPSGEGGPRYRRHFEPTHVEPTQRGRSDQQPRLSRHPVEMKVRETDTRIDIGGEEKHNNSPSKWLLSFPEFSISSSTRSLSPQRNRHTPRSTETKRPVSVPRSSSASSCSAFASSSPSSSPSLYSSASLSSSSLPSSAVPGAWTPSSFSSRLSAFSVWSSLIESGSRSAGCKGTQEPRERPEEDAVSERGDRRHSARQGGASCGSLFDLTPGFQGPDAASPQPCSPTFGFREEKLSLEAFENGQTGNETVASMASVSLPQASPLSSFASTTGDLRGHALPVTTNAPVCASVPCETTPFFFPDNRVLSRPQMACWPSTTHSTSCPSSSLVPSSSLSSSSSFRYSSSLSPSSVASSSSSAASLGPSVSESRPALALRLDLPGDSAEREKASACEDPSSLAFFSPTLLSPTSVHQEVAPPLTDSAESAAVHLERVQLSPGGAPASTVASQMRKDAGEALGSAAACMQTQGHRRCSSPSPRSSSSLKPSEFTSLLSPEELSEFFARELRQMWRHPRFSFSPTRSTNSGASPAAPTSSSCSSSSSSSCSSSSSSSCSSSSSSSCSSSSSSSSIASFASPELMSSRELASAVSPASAGDVRGRKEERREGDTKRDEGKRDICETLANGAEIREGQENSSAASAEENLSWRSSLDSPLSSPSSSFLDFFSDLEIDSDEEAPDEQRRTTGADDAPCADTRRQAIDPTRGFRTSSPRRCSCQESDKIKRNLLGDSENRGASQGMLVTPRGESVACSLNVKTGDDGQNGESRRPRRSNLREGKAPISEGTEIQPRPGSKEANRESCGGGEELNESTRGARDDPEEAKASLGRTKDHKNLRRERRNSQETHTQSKARAITDVGAGGREETRVNEEEEDGFGPDSTKGCIPLETAQPAACLSCESTVAEFVSSFSPAASPMKNGAALTALDSCAEARLPTSVPPLCGGPSFPALLPKRRSDAATETPASPLRREEGGEEVTQMKKSKATLKRDAFPLLLSQEPPCSPRAISTDRVALAPISSTDAGSLSLDLTSFSSSPCACGAPTSVSSSSHSAPFSSSATVSSDAECPPSQASASASSAVTGYASALPGYPSVASTCLEGASFPFHSSDASSPAPFPAAALPAATAVSRESCPSSSSLSASSRAASLFLMEVESLFGDSSASSTAKQANCENAEEGARGAVVEQADAPPKGGTASSALANSNAGVCCRLWSSSSRLPPAGAVDRVAEGGSFDAERQELQAFEFGAKNGEMHPTKRERADSERATEERGRPKEGRRGESENQSEKERERLKVEERGKLRKEAARLRAEWRRQERVERYQERVQKTLKEKAMGLREKVEEIRRKVRKLSETERKLRLRKRQMYRLVDALDAEKRLGERVYRHVSGLKAETQREREALLQEKMSVKRAKAELDREREVLRREKEDLCQHEAELEREREELLKEEAELRSKEHSLAVAREEVDVCRLQLWKEKEAFEEEKDMYRRECDKLCRLRSEPGRSEPQSRRGEDKREEDEREGEEQSEATAAETQQMEREERLAWVDEKVASLRADLEEEKQKLEREKRAFESQVSLREHKLGDMLESLKQQTKAFLLSQERLESDRESLERRKATHAADLKTFAREKQVLARQREAVDRHWERCCEVLQKARKERQRGPPIDTVREGGEREGRTEGDSGAAGEAETDGDNCVFFSSESEGSKTVSSLCFDATPESPRSSFHSPSAPSESLAGDGWPLPHFGTVASRERTNAATYMKDDDSGEGEDDEEEEETEAAEPSGGLYVDETGDRSVAESEPGEERGRRQETKEEGGRQLEPGRRALSFSYISPSCVSTFLRREQPTHRKTRKEATETDEEAENKNEKKKGNKKENKREKKKEKRPFSFRDPLCQENSPEAAYVLTEDDEAGDVQGPRCPEDDECSGGHDCAREARDTQRASGLCQARTAALEWTCDDLAQRFRRSNEELRKCEEALAAALAEKARLAATVHLLSRQIEDSAKKHPRQNEGSSAREGDTGAREGDTGAREGDTGAREGDAGDHARRGCSPPESEPEFVQRDREDETFREQLGMLLVKQEEYQRRVTQAEEEVERLEAHQLQLLERLRQAEQEKETLRESCAAHRLAHEETKSLLAAASAKLAKRNAEFAKVERKARLALESARDAELRASTAERKAGAAEAALETAAVTAAEREAERIRESQKAVEATSREIAQVKAALCAAEEMARKTREEHEAAEAAWQRRLDAKNEKENGLLAELQETQTRLEQMQLLHSAFHSRMHHVQTCLLEASRPLGSPPDAQTQAPSAPASWPVSARSKLLPAPAVCKPEATIPWTTRTPGAREVHCALERRMKSNTLSLLRSPRHPENSQGHQGSRRPHAKSRPLLLPPPDFASLLASASSSSSVSSVNSFCSPSSSTSASSSSFSSFSSCSPARALRDSAATLALRAAARSPAGVACGGDAVRPRPARESSSFLASPLAASAVSVEPASLPERTSDRPKREKKRKEESALRQRVPAETIPQPRKETNAKCGETRSRREDGIRDKDILSGEGKQSRPCVFSRSSPRFSHETCGRVSPERTITCATAASSQPSPETASHPSASLACASASALLPSAVTWFLSPTSRRSRSRALPSGAPQPAGPASRRASETRENGGKIENSEGVEHRSGGGEQKKKREDGKRAETQRGGRGNETPPAGVLRLTKRLATAELHALLSGRQLGC
ncbi:hypothetical protein TGDOM2_213255 [Toxoplasma gondii GAB2-2007-GAL-DOM2]|uniref:Uncharacterized protein n=3 Tax=Toxoplasma gondii TaxID=5811 RepID=V4Z5T8_TOXGV|nr:hypothetical protein TGVEG_213255 [Toxoplasma gondii VEG]KFG40337.1 hypothetical protein TGDOM2_213255 [Toxoplasma gondii GAB2-2007-GAL-DOM2]KFG44267.1 hypothetical protein TGP89_213255 [Toxoplasma gondii p89]CEL72797.1 TPA: hypothetical protein BN1205_035080 [Toxoplasma gondii VEG]